MRSITVGVQAYGREQVFVQRFWGSPYGKLKMLFFFSNLPWLTLVTSFVQLPKLHLPRNFIDLSSSSFGLTLRMVTSHSFVTVDDFI